MGGASLNICDAQTITDAHWMDYLEGVLVLGKGEPTASVTQFQGALPNAAQRKMTADFVRQHRLPRVSVAFLTDSALARGAITAFGWMLPSAQTRAFRPSELDAAVDWLKAVATFDPAEVKRCVHEAWAALRINQAAG